jgi:molybdopterin/thiamine biosynthesis adenylyltransferase
MEALGDVEVLTDSDDDHQVKDMDVEGDEFKDRWSRYIGAMGIEAVAKQATSSIFLSGASAMGIEAAKNIVLAGCKTFILHDTQQASWRDLSG